MPPTVKDAAGRTLHEGDTVGGTTNNPQSTITGQVTEITYSQVCLKVATVSTPSPHAPIVGSLVWLPARRTFLLHTTTPGVQAVAARKGQVTSLRWSGEAKDLRGAARFVGPDLMGAIDGEGGWTLILRVYKGRANPDLVPPQWFILRPPGEGRHRACDPTTYAGAYAPIAVPHTA